MNCPVCLSSDTKVVSRGYPGYREPDRYNIRACGVCRASFAEGPVEQLPEIYNAIYSRIDDVPGYARYAAFAREVSAQEWPLEYLARQELTYYGIDKLLRQKSGAHGPVLEVGSGLGYLTFALNKSGYETVGLDLSRDAVAAARTRFGDYFVSGDVVEFAATANRRFATIIATEVIEHLYDLCGFLEPCLRLLADGGRLMVTTPNRDAYGAGVGWAVEAPPVHLLWLTRQSLEHVARRLGCTVEFPDMSDHPSNKEWTVCHEAPVKDPVLDEQGEVIVRRARPRPLLQRVAGRIVRVLARPTNSPSSVVEPTRRECPTLFAVFRHKGVGQGGTCS